MEIETARTVLYVITAIAAVAWVTGLRFLIVSVRKSGSMDAGAWNGQTDGEAPRGLVVGHAEVEGRPDELSSRTAAMLAREGSWPMEQVKILSRSDGSVVFEGLGGEPGACQGFGLRRGEVRFTTLSQNRTAVDYAVAVRGSRGLISLGAASAALGLVAILVGFWLISSLVVANPNPAVRWQVVQMVQVVHFLWPPFLLGGLARLRWRAVRNRFDVLVHNLPYHED